MRVVSGSVRAPGASGLRKGDWSKVSLPRPSCPALAGRALAEAVGAAETVDFCPSEATGWGGGGAGVAWLPGAAARQVEG